MKIQDQSDDVSRQPLASSLEHQVAEALRPHLISPSGEVCATCGPLKTQWWSHHARVLTDAGLLPTRAEWGVRAPFLGLFASENETEARAEAARWNIPLISRGFTPWRDAT